MRRRYTLMMLCCLLAIANASAQTKTIAKPNIVFIYVDDLGYGDLSCYGATSVKTPNTDRLAAGGLRFTDGHCSASTCTPSRFAILTGSYAFRNKAAILPGDAPLIINPGQQTMPGMLQQAGYTTAAIGKWHLGLGAGHPNWNDSISPGPREIGFNYSFIIPATPDRVPTVFVEDHHVVKLDLNDPVSVSYDHPIGNDPIGLQHPEMLKMQADSQHSGTIVNGVSRIGYMSGGHSAYWKDEDFSEVLTAKALHFIEANRSQPFFLYFALPNVHVPRMSNAKFVGATQMGPRGDDIAEMDWITGQVMDQLRKLNLINNTLVIFTSDNGPVIDDGYADNAESKLGKHQAAGIYKGGKYSAYEGGTRVPLIVSWPGKVKPGVNDALISQVDFFRSLSALAAVPVINSAAPDSRDLSPVLLGNTRQGRTEMIEEAFTMCYRQGNWKYIAPVTQAPPSWLANKKVPTGLQADPQLYNLKTDPAEQHNLAASMPAKTKALADALRLEMAAGSRK
ncbi:arylsulfatase [Mucilaginibacter sp. SMC90]|uniref:sulfatase family protein n=1 Tax=Mucilaginibacter sp. SMC90 TaxID=2929803 RepID=UPI001FB520AB|nr:arylsulfatase [Mucilaginibacter sp. SMC90]UOE47453.1 arylsulfatase [Mucilaginibacter sp. SMC90]